MEYIFDFRGGSCRYVNLGKMTDFIKKGDDPTTAYNKSMGHYGRFSKEDGAVKFIDPRKE